MAEPGANPDGSAQPEPETQPPADGSPATTQQDPSSEPVEVEPETEPRGETLFFDDFEDGDASEWETDVTDGDPDVGSWSIISQGGGRVFQQGVEESDISWAYVGDESWTDQFIELDVQFVSASDPEDGFIYVVARVSAPPDNPDKFSYYWLEFRSNGEFRIRKRTGDGSDDVTERNRLMFVAEPGKWHRIGFRLKGPEMTVWYNGIEVLDAVDQDISHGRMGIGGRDAVFAVDNVRVTVPIDD